MCVCVCERERERERELFVTGRKSSVSVCRFLSPPLSPLFMVSRSVVLTRVSQTQVKLGGSEVKVSPLFAYLQKLPSPPCQTSLSSWWNLRRCLMVVTGRVSSLTQSYSVVCKPRIPLENRWLKKMALQWLPCQAPGVVGSVLELVGLASVYCDWMR